MKLNHKKIAALLGFAVGITGLLVLAGWQYDIGFLKRPIPNLVAMNPVTAFNFVLLGSAVFLLGTQQQGVELNLRRGLVILLASLLVMLIGALKLMDFCFGLGIEPDQLLFTQKIIDEKYIGISNRIAPTTALNFVLSGISLLLISAPSKKVNALANYLLIVIFCIGIFSVLGYFYQVAEFKGFLAVLPMAFHTAICWLLVATALLFVNHNKGFMAALTSNTSGSKVARILLPFSVLIPIVFGYIRLRLNWEHPFSLELGVALLMSSIILVFFSITLYSAVKLYRSDKAKNEIEEKLKKLNEDLENSNQRIFKLFNLSPVATSIVSLENGRFRYANTAFLNLFGLKPEEVIGKTSIEMNINSSESRDRMMKYAAANDFKVSGAEINLRNANGKMLDMLASIEKIELEDGAYLLNTLLDITERKEAEQQALNSNERFFKIFNLSPVPTAIADITNGYRFVNDAFLQLFSFSRAEVIGKTSAQLNMLSEHDRNKIIDYIRQNGNNIRNLELKLKDSKGNLLDVLSSTESIELAGETFVLSTVVNITERKKLEIDLQQTRDGLASAQKIAHMGSWEWNIKTNEEHWSDEQYRIFGYQPNEVPATYSLFQNALHPDDKAAVGIAVEHALAGIKPFDMEYRIVRKDGEVRYIEAKGEIERDSEGKPQLMRGTVLDITNRKEIEEKLKHYYLQLDAKNKEIEQFAFIASHDLQEPLRTIMSFNELLVNEYAEKFDDNGKIYLKYITQSATRMRELITGLLDFSRLGNKKILRKTDCNEVLSDVVANLHTAITESGAIIQAGKLPIIDGYHLELSLLFQNLIVNAIKFRKKDEPLHINISAQRGNNEWKFAFADNGIGIKEKHFEKIFIIFQRLHNRNAYEGTGIGLSHCKKIVELHGGKMWVESTLGIGSTFYFTIAERITNHN